MVSHIHGYTVIEGNDSIHIAALVNAAIKNGWQPQGGLMFDPRLGGRYLQAMVAVAHHPEGRVL